MHKAFEYSRRGPMYQGYGPTVWTKSTRCGPDNGCVEIARLSTEHIGVRDSKIAETSPVLAFSVSEWQSFLGDIRHGKFNLS
jgi:uncharacterized protein DUF397